MKREVLEAAEAAKTDLLVRLYAYIQEQAKQANKFEEREDYKTALRYALNARAERRKYNDVTKLDPIQAVVAHDSAFAFFLERVKQYVAERVKEIHKQLFLAAMRPWEADKGALDNALLDIELVAADLQQFAERYPASIHEYLDYLRSIPGDVEVIMKEI